jgi:formate hydrogenlyase subunit 4
MDRLLQLGVFILLAPLLNGVISKAKNHFRLRRGQSIFQPYYNLKKLFSKEEVVSENASWIFHFAPYAVLASSIAAALLLPVVALPPQANYFGDFFLLIFILAIGRFFLALAGLDTASSFAGMGASREMFISALAEPAAAVAVFVLSLNNRSTSLEAFAGLSTVNFSSLIATAALFMVFIAETSRLPIDNQETHLELTMIHEAMVLEYSGRSLALIEIGAALKQMVWFGLLAAVTYLGFSGGIMVFAAKILGIAIAVSLLEVIIAKMRLFRASDFFAFSLALSILALVITAWGM